jgi:HEAT repeat protein
LSKEELQIYIRQLNHQDPEARYWAVVYLEQSADPESVPALIEVLAGEDLSCAAAPPRRWLLSG